MTWSFFKFDTENTMWDLYFNEQSDNSEENAVWALTEKKTCGNESHEKELKHIHAKATYLFH